jgi:hypothetical protein
MNPVTPLGVAGPAERARHPSAGRWRIDIARAAGVLLRQRPAEGPWPQVAALVTAARGVSGQSAVVYAQRLGVEVAFLRQIEDGQVAVTALPPTLTQAPWWAPALRQLGSAAAG